MVKYTSSLDLDFVFMALANPTRRRILLSLMGGGKSAQNLAEPYEMSLPGVSKHLQVLEKAQLIERQIKGRHHIFSVKIEKMKAASLWVNKFEVFWNEKLENLETFLKKEKE